MAGFDSRPARSRGIFSDALGAVSLLTRVAVAGPVWAQGAAARSAWAFPLVGAGIGALSGLVFFAARLFGLGAAIAAGLSLLAGLFITGVLHEDGLADTADGFFGGRDREQRLAIMRDSRHGTFGVMAIVMSLALRGAALAGIGEPLSALLALIAAHAAARALMPFGAALLRPARSDGLGAAFGHPPAWVLAVAAAIGLAAAVAGLGVIRGPIAFGLSGLCVLGVVELARGAIGGYTGDVLGAMEQVGEIVMLLAAAAR